MSSPPNKENHPVTPTKCLNSSPVEYSPNNPKRALKPISPNKNINTYIGKLNFLEKDNIDEQFNNIHNSHVLIQQQLYNLELQTKQTGVDLGQLCERSKNNNQHLNKLLENIANYSEEVITEGNATKNDITNILSRLDLLSQEFKNFKSIEIQKIVNEELSKAQDILPKNIEKVIQAEVSRVPRIDTNEIKSFIHSEIENIPQKEPLNSSTSIEVVHNEIEKTYQQGLTKLKDFISSKLSEFPKSDPKELQDFVEKELNKTLQPELSKIIHEIKSLESNKTKSQYILESKVEELINEVKRTARSAEQYHNIDNERYESFHQQLVTIQENLLERDIVKQIVDPIVSELKSVSLDSNSQKLLQDILDILAGEKSADEEKIYLSRNSVESIQEIFDILSKQKSSDLIFNEVISHIENNKADNQKNIKQLVQSNTALQASVQSLIQKKDEKIDKLTQALESQTALTNEFLSRNNLNETKAELETKISNLERKFNLLCKSYEEKYIDLKTLQKEFEVLASRANEISSTPDDKLDKLDKVRRLHASKMSEIQENKVDQSRSFNKRIVSTPVDIKNHQFCDSPFEQINEQSETTNNSDEEGF